MGVPFITRCRFRCSDTKAQEPSSVTAPLSTSLESLPLKKTGFLLLLAIQILCCNKDMSSNIELQIMFSIFFSYFNWCKSVCLKG